MEALGTTPTTPFEETHSKRLWGFATFIPLKCHANTSIVIVERRARAVHVHLSSSVRIFCGNGANIFHRTGGGAGRTFSAQVDHARDDSHALSWKKSVGEELDCRHAAQLNCADGKHAVCTSGVVFAFVVVLA